MKMATPQLAQRKRRMDSRIVGQQRPTRHRQPRDPYVTVGTRSLFMTGGGMAFGENQQVLTDAVPGFFPVVSDRVLPAASIPSAAHCHIFREALLA
jgi:hypothetical protein